VTGRLYKGCKIKWSSYNEVLFFQGHTRKHYFLQGLVGNFLPKIGMGRKKKEFIFQSFLFLLQKFRNCDPTRIIPQENAIGEE